MVHEMKTTKQLLLLTTLVFGLSACSEEERTINVEHEGQISIKELEEDRKARERIGSNRDGKTSKERVAEIKAKQAARRERIAKERAEAAAGK